MLKPGPKPRPRKATVRIEIRCTPVERGEIHAAAIVSGERSTNQWALDLLLEAAREQRAAYIRKYGKSAHTKIAKELSDD